MDTSKILKSKLQRVTVGASAAKTVVEEYVDGHNRRTIKQKGNQRLMKDRAYLNRLSKLVIHTVIPWFTRLLWQPKNRVNRKSCYTSHSIEKNL